MGHAGTSGFTEETMREVGAIVLGGGQGKRLYPLTKVRAKPAVPLCGRYRLIDIPLSNCINSGIDRIAVLTQFNSHSLNRHVNNTYKFDDFTPGYVTILAAEQTDESRDWFQGTADAVRKHLRHIRQYDIEHYVILSGDHLYHMDYRNLIATHLKKNADITVSAIPMDARDAQGFGIMKVRKNGRISKFVEKPGDPAVLEGLVTPEEVFKDFRLSAERQPYLASMGIYVFRAEVLERQLAQHPEWVDFGKQLLPKSLSTHRVFAHMFSGFWRDIGTVRSYFDVSMALTSPNPPFVFHHPGRPIYTHARSLPGARIIDAQIKNAIVCAGSRIERANVSNAIIGIRSIVQPGAEIHKSIILGADYFESKARRGRQIPVGIGGGAKITCAIVDHNARIGRNVVIRGSKKLKDHDGNGFSIRDGIVVVHRNAVIPNGTTIG